MDDFIHKARSGANELFGGLEGAAQCILTSDSTANVRGGSRYPMQAFQSPFIGKSVEDIYKIFSDKIRGEKSKALADFAFFACTILDEQTAKDKSTCLIVSDAPDGENEIGPKKWAYRTIRTEFANSLYHAIKLDEQRETILELKEDKEDLELIRWQDEYSGKVDPEKWERLPADGAS